MWLRDCWDVAFAALLLLGCFFQGGRGIAAIGELNAADVPLSSQRWVWAAAKRNNSNAQLSLANHLYFAPRRFPFRANSDGISEAPANSEVPHEGGEGRALRLRQRRRREAAAWYKRAAEAGNPDAQNMLGVFYSLGLDGFPHDQARAVLFHTLAAAGGNLDSKLALAERHLHGGRGVPKSCSAAAELYSDVADELLRKADTDGEFVSFQHADINQLAHKSGPRIRTPGGGIRGLLPQSLQELWDSWLRLQESADGVLEFYQLEADHGNSFAQFHLGRIQHFGRHSASSLTRQPRKAYNNFLLAARESDPDAEIDDTQDSQESSKDVDNPKTSRRWSQRERRKEHARKVRELQKQRLSREPKALFMLGHMELHGYGTRQNTTLARKRFRELASEETSHAIAASMLGYMDLYGLNGDEAGALGALPNYASTVTNFFHAASHHDVDALYSLGLLHMVGTGVPQSFSIAGELFFQAAEVGRHYLAMIRLGQMYLRGLGFQQSCTKAVQLIKPAVERAVFGAAMEEANRNYWEGDELRAEEASRIFLHAAEGGVMVAKANAAVLLREFQTFFGNFDEGGVGGQTTASALSLLAKRLARQHGLEESATASAESASDQAASAGEAELIHQATGWSPSVASWLPQSLFWPPLTLSPLCSELRVQLLGDAADEGHVASIIALGDCHYASYTAFRSAAWRRLLGTGSAVAKENVGKATSLRLHEVAQFLNLATISASRAAREYFRAAEYGTGSDAVAAESYGQAMFSLAYLRLFGVAVTPDVKLVERYADAVVDVNPEAIWFVGPAVYAARFYFYCQSLAPDDWDSIAIAIAVGLIIVILSTRYILSLDAGVVLSFPTAHISAVVAYAVGFAVVTGVFLILGLLPWIFPGAWGLLS